MLQSIQANIIESIYVSLRNSGVTLDLCNNQLPFLESVDDKWTLSLYLWTGIVIKVYSLSNSHSRNKENVFVD